MRSRIPVIAVAAQVAITLVAIGAFLLYLSSRPPGQEEGVRSVSYAGPAMGPQSAEPERTVPVQTTYRGNNARTGVYQQGGLGDSHKIIWQAKDIHGNKQMPEVSGNTLYYVAGNYLAAVDTKTGREQWNYKVKGPIDDSPVVSGGTAYLRLPSGQNMSLNAFDLEAQDFRWTYENAGYAAIADEQSVYVCVEKAYLALDPETGAQKWLYPLDFRFGVQSATLADRTLFLPVYKSQPNPSMAFGSDRANSLVAIDAATGAERWHADNLAQILGWPAVSAGTVYIVSSTFDLDHMLEDSGIQTEIAGKTLLQAFNANNGAELWRYELPQQIVSPVAVSGDTVVFTYEVESGDRAYLRALDSKTGAEKWAVEQKYFETSPSIAGNQILIVAGMDPPDPRNGSRPAKLFAFDIATGVEVWSLPLDNNSYSDEPVIADGVIYLSSSRDLKAIS